MSNDTGFFIEGAPLPPNFQGTPQEFFEAMLERMKIVSPFTIQTFVVGDIEPTSNEGPWLKGGDRWWVWSDEEARYVPIDISDSLPPPYLIQEDEPEDTDPPLWFKIDGDKFVGAYLRVSGDWVPMTGSSGTTAERPITPYDYQKYYDTDCQCEIWFERGAWRTVSGTKGDVKHVTWATAEEALSRNPGWEILGTGETNNQDWRGRIISQATKNTGAGPTTSLTLGGGITERAATDTFGTETHQLTTAQIPAHNHEMRGYALDEMFGQTNESPNKVIVEDDYDVNVQVSQNTQNTGGGEAHNNIQPTLALWCLRKT